MPFFVYIIKNDLDNELYKGFTTDPIARLIEHNNYGTAYTSTKAAWQFVFLTNFENKKEALIFERKIKRWNAASLANLIKSPMNRIDQIL